MRGPNDDAWLAFRLKRMLEDLRSLARRFGLIVAGHHETTGAWAPLPELIRRAGEGLPALEGFELQVYVEDDYLGRWRGDFARRLGYASIPGVMLSP
jgi:hypothetical protein